MWLYLQTRAFERCWCSNDAIWFLPNGIWLDSLIWGGVVYVWTENDQIDHAEKGLDKGQGAFPSWEVKPDLLVLWSYIFCSLRNWGKKTFLLKTVTLMIFCFSRCTVLMQCYLKIREHTFIFLLCGHVTVLWQYSEANDVTRDVHIALVTNPSRPRTGVILEVLLEVGWT